MGEGDLLDILPVIGETERTAPPQEDTKMCLSGEIYKQFLEIWVLQNTEGLQLSILSEWMRSFL